MNKFQKQIENGEKPIGIFTGLCNASVVECIGLSGFDYVIIDNEHSPAEAETSAELIRAADAAGITPFVRVREISRPAVLKLLDVGAQGLIVPNVNSVEDVEKLVSFSKYSPIGNRGFCPSRKDGWGHGLDMNVADTMEYFNHNVLLIPQCETTGALENIETITAINGVDGIFIGPFDLSISMGIPGDFNHPEFKKALRRILQACRENGKFCMIFASGDSDAVSRLKEGFDSLTYYVDAVLMIECFRNRLKAIKTKAAE